MQLSYTSNNAGMKIIPLAAPSDHYLDHYDEIRITKSYSGISWQYVGNIYITETFRLTDVYLLSSTGTGAALQYSGTAMLNIGYDDPIPVLFGNATFENISGYTHMVSGTVYIDEPVELPKIGVTIASLTLKPDAGTIPRVSGYVKGTIAGQNLMGDRNVYEFIDAELRVGHIIAWNDIPQIRYHQFTILEDYTLDSEFRRHSITRIWIRLDTTSNDFIRITGCRVSMKSNLETLNNEGIVFDQVAMLYFNRKGEISTDMRNTPGTYQSLQMLVPGGVLLRVSNAYLVLIDGVSDKTSYLNGKLILPFERPGVDVFANTANYAGHHPDTNEMDDLFDLYQKSHADRTNDPDYINVDDKNKMSLNEKLFHFGQNVQDNALLIVPDDEKLQEFCAYVDISVIGWSGAGFTVEDAWMSPPAYPTAISAWKNSVRQPSLSSRRE